MLAETVNYEACFLIITLEDGSSAVSDFVKPYIIEPLVVLEFRSTCHTRSTYDILENNMSGLQEVSEALDIQISKFASNGVNKVNRQIQY